MARVCERNTEEAGFSSAVEASEAVPNGGVPTLEFSLVMERVYFKVHQRCIGGICKRLSPKQRIIGEIVILLCAIVSLSTLFLLHKRYSSYDNSEWFSCSSIGDSAGEARTADVVDLLVTFDDKQRFPLHTFTYATHPAYLMLPRDLYAEHDIKATTVAVAASDNCFGGPLSSFLLANVVGYETFWLNWAFQTFDGKGALSRRPSSSEKDLVRLNKLAVLVERKRDKSRSMWSRMSAKTGSLLAIAFIFYIVSTMVSFTLRQTQQKMLRFAYLLQHSVRYNRPWAALVLTHSLDSLVFVPMMVGMLFFLFEFFEDQMLALLVLSCVWLSEVYSIIVVRTKVSLVFFPRIFFGVFLAFHLYLFAFPGGFTHVAMAVTTSHLLLAMAILWNHVEVPALCCGKISISTPREWD